MRIRFVSILPLPRKQPPSGRNVLLSSCHCQRGAHMAGRRPAMDGVGAVGGYRLRLCRRDLTPATPNVAPSFPLYRTLEPRTIGAIGHSTMSSIAPPTPPPSTQRKVPVLSGIPFLVLHVNKNQFQRSWLVCLLPHSKNSQKDLSSLCA